MTNTNTNSESLGRGARLVRWGIIFLIASWVSCFLTPMNHSEELKIIDLLWIPIYSIYLTTFFINWKWIKRLVLSAKLIEPTSIKYRIGWSFWGWITPIAGLWIPISLIRDSNHVFNRSNNYEFDFDLIRWWSCWITSWVISWVAFFLWLFFDAESYWIPEFILNTISTWILTIAFPIWQSIVFRVEQNHNAAITHYQAN